MARPPAGLHRRGARGSLRRVSAVPIARRIEALEPLKALYAEIRHWRMIHGASHPNAGNGSV